ncbi:hypothetical protein [Niallia sp. FSL M8-0099]|uniref:hypothetical protein n=1 Tax=Niallia sp. FSL M8-0099 TaxID=2954519 RepID=UPI0030F7C8F1
MTYMLFGASESGKEVLSFLNEYVLDIKISCFLDNDINKKFYKGLVVKHPDQVMLKQGCDVVIITSQYYNEIRKQLLSKGLRENIDFFNGTILYNLSIQLKQVKDKFYQLSKEGIKYSIVGNKDLGLKKTSDTIFLLGSGSSINKINEVQWEHIRQNDSWGFNYWPVHDYKPTFYSFEITPKKNKILLTNMVSNYIKKINHNGSYPLDFIKDIIHYSSGDLNDLKNSVTKVPFVKDAFLPIKDEQEMESTLVLLDKLKLLDNDIIYRSVASIVTLTLIAIKLGYKNIILCGIDMNDSKYFYFETDYYKKRKFLLPEQSQKNSSLPHETMQKDGELLGADKILKIINNKFAKPRGVNIYVANKSSALYPDFILYEDWYN